MRTQATATGFTICMPTLASSTRSVARCDTATRVLTVLYSSTVQTVASTPSSCAHTVAKLALLSTWVSWTLSLMIFCLVTCVVASYGVPAE
jgi:hypothetical protein